MARPPKELVDAICESLRERPEEWRYYSNTAVHRGADTTVRLKGEYGLPVSVAVGCTHYGFAVGWPFGWLSSWRRRLRSAVVSARATSGWEPEKERARRFSEEMDKHTRQRYEEDHTRALTSLRGAA